MMSRSMWFGRRYREDSGRVEENTEVYMDTVPFAERWLVLAVFMAFLTDSTCKWLEFV
jgi:hypothetical protein